MRSLCDTLNSEILTHAEVQSKILKYSIEQDLKKLQNKWRRSRRFYKILKMLKKLWPQ